MTTQNINYNEQLAKIIFHYHQMVTYICLSVRLKIMAYCSKAYILTPLADQEIRCIFDDI